MKKNDKCSRRLVLKRELKDDWDKMNLASKSLIFIGMILFLCIIFITFYSHGNENLTKSIEVIFRSSIASIFGFLLSSNIKKISFDKVYRTIDDDSKDGCEEERKKYNYEDGNLVQMLIALTICITSIIVILLIYITNITDNIAAISQLRDFMCTSIGFLLGEAKIKK